MANIRLLGIICIAACIAGVPGGGNAGEQQKTDPTATDISGTGAEEELYPDKQPEPGNPLASDAPVRTLDGLASRLNDWHEPSEQSESHYVQAIRLWLESLEPKQQKIARKILADAHPGLHALRIAIREKKSELASLRFDRNTSPDTLPRLGQELSNLRRTLNTKLKEVGDRLHKEAGVSMGPLGGDGFWLVPSEEPKSRHKVEPRSSSLESHSQAMLDILLLV